MFALMGLWGTYLNSMVGVTAASLVSDGPLIDFWGQLAKALERKSGYTLSPKKAAPEPWGKVKREEENRPWKGVKAAKSMAKMLTFKKEDQRPGKRAET